MNEKILVADDNSEIREIINVLLTSEGYEVIEATDGLDALEKMEEAVDLIILDIMMPHMSGIKTCLEMRKTTNAPILFLTAKTQDSDKALGFSSGGDDYLSKPFSYTELVSRVKALLRRYCVYQGKNTEAETAPCSLLHYQDFQIDENTHTVTHDHREILLTEIEFKILTLLVRNKNKIFSPQNLYESVWEEPYFYSANNTLMVHIRNLRKKIEVDPQHPKYIVTVWGKGYRCV